MCAEKRRRSPAMTTEGGVEVMTTEGGVEVQLERKARQGRERERRIRLELYRPRGAGGHPETQ